MFWYFCVVLTLSGNTSVADANILDGKTNGVITASITEGAISGTNLLEDLTAIENTLLVQELTGSRDVSRAKELLTIVGLDGLEDRFPYELSGGQQQRVAIARSLAKKPKVLLADEPTGNLDGKTTEQVMKALSDICQKENITAILVTHDDSLLQYASRVIRIDSGKLISDELIAED